MFTENISTAVVSIWNFESIVDKCVYIDGSIINYIGLMGTTVKVKKIENESFGNKFWFFFVSQCFASHMIIKWPSIDWR